MGESQQLLLAWCPCCQSDEWNKPREKANKGVPNLDAVSCIFFSSLTIERELKPQSLFFDRHLKLKDPVSSQCETPWVERLLGGRGACDSPLLFPLHSLYSTPSSLSSIFIEHSPYSATVDACPNLPRTLHPVIIARGFLLRNWRLNGLLAKVK